QLHGSRRNNRWPRSEKKQTLPQKDQDGGQSEEQIDSEEADPITKQDLQLLFSNIEKMVKAEHTKTTKELTTEITSLGTRVRDLEKRLDDITDYTHQVDKDITTLYAQIEQIQYAQEDAENRSRRNNIRLHGIPETATDLEPLLTDMFQGLLPDTPPERLEMDRAHRALRPKPSPEERPRDVIVRMHFYRVKAAILEAVRPTGEVEIEGHKIALYPDIAPSTLARRREFKPLTELLRQHKITYRWGYPFSLQASHQNRTITIRNLKDRERFLRSLLTTTVLQRHLSGKSP
uniref:L1 transposable element RRM domain-containing protein n=1 Tax=Xenopus tropicalis TaxID=8364 RepID=A0A803K9Z1_XENTR